MIGPSHIKLFVREHHKNKITVIWIWQINYLDEGRCCICWIFGPFFRRDACVSFENDARDRLQHKRILYLCNLLAYMAVFLLNKPYEKVYWVDPPSCPPCLFRFVPVRSPPCDRPTMPRALSKLTTGSPQIAKSATGNPLINGFFNSDWVRVW